MLRLLLPIFITCTSAAVADVPRIATDIAPVQGLVAAVLGDLGDAALVVPKGTSPHDHALRPSEARQLQSADLVVWIGPDLMPNLAKPLETLASTARILTLSDVPGSLLLSNRTAAVFALPDPDTSHPEADHDHKDEAAEPRDTEAGSDHAHPVGGHDPHLWLDPGNALIWLDAIHAQLADLDPEHAAAYAENAARAKAAVTSAAEAARTRLAASAGRQYLSLHDAYQYFEHAFDLHPLGAVSLSDATSPGPSRLAALRDVMARSDVRCVLAEPGAALGFLTALDPASRLRVAEVDPMGAAIPPGPEFYPTLISDTADRIADCLMTGS
ncbi:zinc ABC transporter substrate-binding protein [Puniceibacterium confluentis]|uniref:zinc ABC transporter substrate-binding protein n=1 Tax=Puniceibacterium confluentis TaxID=1958944 RepID=UPI0011B569F4|nr:zinc ABC transporter substrate-binding protein [Puniceibacterium confluentis]